VIKEVGHNIRKEKAMKMEFVIHPDGKIELWEYRDAHSVVAGRPAEFKGIRKLYPIQAGDYIIKAYAPHPAEDPDGVILTVIQVEGVQEDKGVATVSEVGCIRIPRRALGSVIHLLSRFL
jgi:hypothetical protein